jgi:hypothetical protein
MIPQLDLAAYNTACPAKETIPDRSGKSILLLPENLPLKGMLLMMSEILSFCGFRCDLCRAYAGNQAGPAEKQRLSDGWFKYFGFRVPPEDLHCAGCRNDGKILDTECTVRPCAREKKVDHCAHCDNFICDRLKTRFFDFAEMEKTHGTIPEEDYRDFIEPYLGRERLTRLRKI